MADIKVKAKVTGVHAVTGLNLVAGETYHVDAAIARAATEVFELVVEAAADDKTKKTKEGSK